MNDTSSKFKASHLSPDEKIEIAQKVDYEITKSHYQMIKMGSIANIIGGAFFVWIFHSQGGDTQKLILGLWYAGIVIISLADILWASRYEARTINLKQLKTWRRFFLYLVAGISLTWGLMGVLFIHGAVQYQITTFAFLLAVLICFSFSTATDFTVAAISISGILLPSILYRLSQGVATLSGLREGLDPNFGISISFVILGIFLLIACYIGSKIVRNFFRLNFENILLNEKLESLNQVLEQRVKDRTRELENSLELVTYQATHDLLTNLPNQRLMIETIETAIQKANETDTLFAIACFSLNELEKINDGLGYEVGDLAIQQITKRFLASFDGKETTDVFTIMLSRRDVFIILLKPILTAEEVETKVEKLFTVLQNPIRIQKQRIKLTASIGVSIYPRDGQDVHTLLMNADAARVSANKQGGNACKIYHVTLNADFSRQIEIENKLDKAVSNHEFFLQYQPFVDLKTNEICGMEALIRWRNPTLGIVSPMDFIPIAEANGTIIPIGEWVLRTACAQTALWHRQGFPSLKVSINLSAKQLHQKNILHIIMEILQETSLTPEAVELELTETEAFKGDAIPILTQFKALGLRLSIDDFGTGYSALSSLKLLEVDKIKIDKSFVDDVENNEDSRAIVSHTISLGKKLGVDVIAEGVETIGQLNFLIEAGCDMVQGYYFSRPLDPSAFIDLLKEKATV